MSNPNVKEITNLREDNIEGAGEGEEPKKTISIKEMEDHINNLTLDYNKSLRELALSQDKLIELEREGYEFLKQSHSMLVNSGILDNDLENKYNNSLEKTTAHSVEVAKKQTSVFHLLQRLRNDEKVFLTSIVNNSQEMLKQLQEEVKTLKRENAQMIPATIPAKPDRLRAPRAL